MSFADQSKHSKILSSKTGFLNFVQKLQNAFVLVKIELVFEQFLRKSKENGKQSGSEILNKISLINYVVYCIL